MRSFFRRGIYFKALLFSVAAIFLRRGFRLLARPRQLFLDLRGRLSGR